MINLPSLPSTVCVIVRCMLPFGLIPPNFFLRWINSIFHGGISEWFIVAEADVDVIFLIGIFDAENSDKNCHNGGGTYVGLYEVRVLYARFNWLLELLRDCSLFVHSLLANLLSFVFKSMIEIVRSLIFTVINTKIRLTTSGYQNFSTEF